MHEHEIRQIKRDLEDRGVMLTDIAKDVDRTVSSVSQQLRKTKPAQDVLDAIAERMKAPVVDEPTNRDGTAPL